MTKSCLQVYKHCEKPWSPRGRLVESSGTQWDVINVSLSVWIRTHWRSLICCVPVCFVIYMSRRVHLRLTGLMSVSGFPIYVHLVVSNCRFSAIFQQEHTVWLPNLKPLEAAFEGHRRLEVIPADVWMFAGFTAKCLLFLHQISDISDHLDLSLFFNATSSGVIIFHHRGQIIEMLDITRDRLISPYFFFF